MNKYLVLVLFGLLGACSDTNDDELTCDDGVCVEETDGSDTGGIADKDGGANLALKTQALGTACPARVYGMLTTPDSRFNGSGWEGEWNLYQELTYVGIRQCNYNTYGLHYAGYTVGRSCVEVPGTNRQGWLCGLTRVNCPETAQVTAVSSYRQSAGGTKVWGTPGSILVTGVPAASYQSNSGSFDSVNKRIWCGYPVAVTLSFTRSESF